ncbi:hypothetical protein BGZ89_001828 [Linnemannia elongata]|nr:hypothetical protein BGZ89_001828 [Linnemannia elongata]
MGFWDTITGAFSRDGDATRFLEKIPLVGYGVAGVQALTGNPDHAKRALATSTNSLITTAGSVGGFVVGGPLGAVAGGALASQVGMVTEFGISKTIDDDKVKGDVGEISVKRALLDAAIGGAAGVIGGGAGASTVGKEAGRLAIEGTAQVVKSAGYQTMGSIISKTAGDQAARGVANGAASALAQAGRGLIKSDEKDPEPKKKVRRVVTIGQQTKADEVIEACNRAKIAIPLVATKDAYHTLILYWDQFVKAGFDWGDANRAVEMQYEAYQNKKKAQENYDGLWTRCEKEVDEIIRQYEEHLPYSPVMQKIVDMYVSNPHIGRDFIRSKIQEIDMEIYLLVNHLRGLMETQINWREETV